MIHQCTRTSANDLEYSGEEILWRRISYFASDFEQSEQPRCYRSDFARRRGRKIGSLGSVPAIDPARWVRLWPRQASPAHTVQPATVGVSRSSGAPPPEGFRNARPCSLYYGQLVARYQANYEAPLPRFQGSYRPYAVCGYVPSCAVPTGPLGVASTAKASR